MSKNYSTGKNNEVSVKGDSKAIDVRTANIFAAKAVADAVRTSLGPRGMDKMIVQPNDEILITNDGATILKQFEVTHPCAKMLVELSKSQDIEAGDGTTSVVVIAGALLDGCLKLLKQGVHATVISDCYGQAVEKAVSVLEGMSTKVDLSERDQLIKSAIISLGSKVVSQYADTLAPLAVDAVLKIIDPKTATNVDLRDIRVVKRLGGTLEDTELVEGFVFDQPAIKRCGGPTKMKNAKIALIQFQISPPKTDMDSQIVVSDSSQIDRILKEESKYLLDICKKIKKSGANVLLIQKSILRDSTTEMSLHFLAKMGIMVIEDIERNEIEFIAKTLGCKPVAHVDHLRVEKLGSADLIEEISLGEEKIVKVSGIQNKGKTVTILCRASNNLILEEADRSLHDAFCVIRSLVKKKMIIAGGGAPEMEVSHQLKKYSRELTGNASVCFRVYAECLEVVPTTLAGSSTLCSFVFLDWEFIIRIVVLYK
jgi:T-complex protein 1 subunit delta